MKLTRTENYIKTGILMSKLLSRGFFGNVYDKRTVTSLDEINELSKQGFGIEEIDVKGFNISFCLCQDLKDISESSPSTTPE